jgi:hypothetical protein
MKQKYPDQVCAECAKDALDPMEWQDLGLRGFTLWEDVCPVCDENKMVTSPRNYGWPLFKGFDRP